MKKNKNGDYWRERFSLLEESTHKKAENYVHEVEKQFMKTSMSIQADIERWYGRFAENNNITLLEAKKLLKSEELAEFKWTVEEYIEKGGSLNPKWLKQLENASARVHISRLESLQFQIQHKMELLYGNHMDSLDKVLRDIYSSGYYHTAFEIQKGFNIGWDLQSINTNQLEKILSKPWTADNKTFKDRCWTDKANLINSVQAQLVQGVIKGDNPFKSVNGIAKQFSVSKSRASRLIMTESAFFSSQAQKDCFNELDIERYEIVVALDELTCDICGSMEGLVFKMSEYVAGVTANPLHPRCRCCTAPYFKDNFGERIARDKDGKTYYVPSDMTFNEWKKTFANDNSKNGYEKTSKNSIIKKENLFNNATTIKNAEDYAKNTLGVPNVSYKGVDIDTANEWNKGLHDAFVRFPELKQNFGFVGECHERNVMIKKAVFEDKLSKYIKVNPNVDIEILKPHVQKRIDMYMKNLAISNQTMAQSLKKGVDPILDQFSGVTVNKSYGKSASDFKLILKSNVDTKFHPIGCDTIRSVLDHEIGHQLDKLLNISAKTEINSLYSTNDLFNMLSKYATFSKSEMVAEAWSEYCNNPNPRQVAKTVGKLIEKEYETKFRR